MRTIKAGDTIMHLLMSKLHGEVELYDIQLREHIKSKHHNVSLTKIESIVTDPDAIYKESKNSKTYFYEKKIGEHMYRTVISKNYKSRKIGRRKVIATTYKVRNYKWYDPKLTICLYERGDIIEFEEKPEYV